MIAWSLLAVKEWFQPSKATLRARRAELRAQAALNMVARMKARYDAAQTTSENEEHWSQADDRSARAANSLPVRRMLRKRARYEASNNSYLAGMLLTLANDTVGTGPRLRMRLESDADNRKVQQEFATWAREVQLVQKLRTMVISRVRDGESFVRLFTNAGLNSPVWLDIEVLEGDQVTTPTLVPSPNHIDGIIFGESGQPLWYEILRQHPGDDYAFSDFTPDKVNASQVLHWFPRLFCRKG